jgi:hypothetical protein
VSGRLLNQIPIYLEGGAVSFAAPLKIVQRAEARQFKKEGIGYFVSHGRAFVLYHNAAEELRLRDFIRDTPKTCGESASIQPPTMNNYVAGCRSGTSRS